MTFRFLHTADWQLGKPFGTFPPDLRARLRAARIDMIDRIAGLARSEGAKHVIVAGDVFDQESPSEETVRQSLDRLTAAADVTWWLLPGNHDPARANGLWDRIGERLPPNVAALTETGASEMTPGVHLLAAPWRSKAPGRDLTDDFGSMATPPSARRIGVAHGGVVEFSQDAPQSSAIAPDRRQRAGLDYLALGDWHGYLKVAEGTYYPGTPEPDRYPKNNPGTVLSVSLGQQGEMTVSPHSVAMFQWRRLEVVFRDDEKPEDAVSAQLDTLARKTDAIVHLQLSGRLRLPARSRLAAFLEAERAAMALLTWEDDNLLTAASADDLDDIDRAGTLREAAETLLAQSEEPSSSETERADARLALDFLAAFAQGSAP